MNIAGNRYGQLIILEDKREKDDRGTYIVTTQSDCGKIKNLPKAVFIAGSNPTKCLQCHRKYAKRFSIAFTAHKS
jgi:hypothetical protein